jgi:16S rRNA G966 N2-methylase RsmD
MTNIPMRQFMALLECAEALTDIIIADPPYDSDELEREFLPCLNELYESGIRLGGEV